MKTILLTILTMLMPFMANAGSRITSGDILTITITGVPADDRASISAQYSVTSEGYIKLPYLTGQIKASGSTPGALARTIETAYRTGKIYTNPEISIVNRGSKEGCILVHPRTVTVSGMCRVPGPKPFRPGMTLMEVVSMAAPNEFAALNRVELLRNGKLYKYDLKKNPRHQMLKVYPNDQITLKKVIMVGK